MADLLPAMPIVAPHDGARGRLPGSSSGVRYQEGVDPTPTQGRGDDGAGGGLDGDVRRQASACRGRPQHLRFPRP